MKPLQPIINHIDGWLYVGMAVCTSAVAILTSADAVSLVPASAIFYAKSFFELMGAAFLAGKTYRSTTFGKKQEQDQAASGAPQAVPVVATMAPTQVGPVTVKDPIAPTPETVKITT